MNSKHLESEFSVVIGKTVVDKIYKQDILETLKVNPCAAFFLWNLRGPCDSGKEYRITKQYKVLAGNMRELISFDYVITRLSGVHSRIQ